MKVVFSLLLCVLIAAFPLIASAQVSTTLLEAALDEQVSVELVDGRVIEGRLMRSTDDVFVVRSPNGRLVELNRNDVVDVYIVETPPAPREVSPPATTDQRSGEYLPPSAPTPPPVDHEYYVTRAEYEEAYQHYASGRRFAFMGTMAMAASGVTLVVGLVSNNRYKDGCWNSYDEYYDDENEYDECKQLHRRLRASMFVLTPLLFGGGLSLNIIGNKRKAIYGPTVRTFQSQERERRIQERRYSERPGLHVRELSLSPMFARDGGGASLRMTF